MLGLTIVGFLGAICFALCAAPQVWKAYKTKSTGDISMLYIILSIGGNVFSGIYIGGTNYLTGYWQIPQYFNYSIALTLVIILMFMKIKYDKLSDKNGK